MIKDNQKLFNRLHVLLDAVIIVIAYVAAWYFDLKVVSLHCLHGIFL